MQHSRWNFRQVIRLNINDTAHYDFKHISIRANIKNSHPHPQFWDEPPAQMVFITWRLASCAKPELILWLWKKIRKSWCACLHIVMFCHGWQNKASRATDGSLNAGHVTPRKSNSDTLRLFLFSYNGTKINSGFAQNAIHRPTTHHLDGRSMSTTSQNLVWNPWNEKNRKRQAFHNLPLSLILQPAARWLFPPVFPQQW